MTGQGVDQVTATSMSTDGSGREASGAGDEPERADAETEPTRLRQSEDDDIASGYIGVDPTGR